MYGKGEREEKKERKGKERGPYCIQPFLRFKRIKSHCRLTFVATTVTTLAQQSNQGIIII